MLSTAAHCFRKFAAALFDVLSNASKVMHW